MGKILEKIRQSLFGDKLVEDQIIAICKDKKVRDTEKFRKCLDLVGEYYVTKHHNRVDYETYEEYYECFHKNNLKDEQKYKKYYNNVHSSINRTISVKLQGSVKDLKDINVQELSEEEMTIYEKILECTKMYFPENFDYKHYYLFVSDPESYKKISDNILGDIIQNYKQKNNIETDLFSVNNVEEFGK